MEQKKYEITNISHPECPWLHRIVALTCVGEDVKPGDVGGYVQSEKNLSQEGSCWLYDDALSYEDAVVDGDAKLRGRSMARGNAHVTFCAEMTDEARAEGDCRIEAANVTQGARVTGNAVLSASTNGICPLIAGRANVYGSVSGGYVIRGLVLPHQQLFNETEDVFILDKDGWDLLHRVQDRKDRGGSRPPDDRER